MGVVLLRLRALNTVVSREAACGAALRPPQRPLPHSAGVSVPAAAAN